jgi:DMSO/TMAO reductase YedYZ molybdopterin-dependent catalytic subunit
LTFEAKPNAGRTVHGIPKHAREQAANPVLRIDGLVAKPLELSRAQSLDLAHARYLELFDVPAENFIPALDWAGPTLATLIATARPLPNALWMKISAGPYAVAVPLPRAERALLCDMLEGEPLSLERGGPWRLLIPDRGYNMSVKWVDHVELSATEPDDSAIRIAEARERARQFHRTQEETASS